MSSHLVPPSWIRQRHPQVESLESRWNPSTVHFDDGTLVIVGTREADTVAIVDDGDGGVEVTFDNTAGAGGQNGSNGSNGSHNGSGSGSNDSRNDSNGSNGSDSNGDGGAGGITTRAFDNVDRVIFLGLGGDDVVTYDLTGPLVGDLDIELFLGSGADVATLNLQPGAGADAQLHVNVD